MNATDKRNKFDERVFSYQVSKGGKVFIHWYGKQVMILKGNQAQKFRHRPKLCAYHQCSSRESQSGPGTQDQVHQLHPRDTEEVGSR